MKIIHCFLFPVFAFAVSSSNSSDNSSTSEILADISLTFESPILDGASLTPDDQAGAQMCLMRTFAETFEDVDDDKAWFMSTSTLKAPSLLALIRAKIVPKSNIRRGLFTFTALNTPQPFEVHLEAMIHSEPKVEDVAANSTSSIITTTTTTSIDVQEECAICPPRWDDYNSTYPPARFDRNVKLTKAHHDWGDAVCQCIDSIMGAPAINCNIHVSGKSVV